MTQLRPLRPLLRLLTAVALATAAQSCVTEDVPDNTRHGNFEACWQLLDEHYCFFAEKADAYGLDWNEVRSRYAARIDEGMTNYQLFDVLAEMTAELHDGHVNLTAAHNTARYGAWFDNFPMNFSDSLLHKYLGRSEDFRQTAALQYRVLPDNTGYIRCSTFDVSFGNGNLEQVMEALAMCDGLIIDVRSNGGGQISSAEKLASLFINEEQTLGYMSHKTGRAHDALSTPKAIRVSPFKGLRWQKPVCVLTNRRTYSAANTFVMYVKGLPNVAVVGDRTGGGAGMPFTQELPNGWGLRFSACPMYDRHMQLTESGIDPDVRADITPADYARSVDTIIETALKLLRQH